jgi:hypothetical protein
MKFSDHEEISSPTQSKIRKPKKSKSASKFPSTPKNPKSSVVYREVKLYSPFEIETPPTRTPPGIRTSTRSRVQ